MILAGIGPAIPVIAKNIESKGMNKSIERLCSLSNKSERTVLGAISGTSMDGIDLALCRISGSGFDTKVSLLEYASIPVDRKIGARFAELSYRPEAPAGELLRLDVLLGRCWAKAIREKLNEWSVEPQRIDLLASHGQTVLHLPDREGRHHATWQLVEGDLLAQELGIITVSDFRKKLTALGEEGAPLAPLGELFLFSSDEEDRLLLNLGGIANFTCLPARNRSHEIPFATDTGPANTLIDEAVRRLVPGRSYDENGEMARAGRLHSRLLEKLLAHPFFLQEAPKSTGQEDFGWKWLHETVMKHAPEIGINDLLETLTELTARTVTAQIMKGVAVRNLVLYVSGGGWHNRYLIERIAACLPRSDIRSSSELGIEPDAKEALLFAVIANETVAGRGWITKEGRHFTAGKISLP